jgi:hypothetical protein
VKEVAPVPPPPTTAVVNEGFEEDPFETRGIPEVELGATEVMLFPVLPTRTLYCVRDTPEIAPVLVAFRIPVTPEFMELL